MSSLVDEPDDVTNQEEAEYNSKNIAPDDDRGLESACRATAVNDVESPLALGAAGACVFALETVRFAGSAVLVEQHVAGNAGVAVDVGRA